MLVTEHQSIHLIPHRRLLTFCLVALFAPAGPGSYAEEPTEPAIKVAPTNPLIRYEGRFDFRKEEGPRFTWPGSSITVKFTGTSISAELSGDQNRIEVIVDDEPKQTLSLHTGMTLYPLADHLAKDRAHTLQLFHRTESLFGIAEFGGFQIETGGSLQELPAGSDRRIEFIGDSITCGYGNEAANEHEHFSPDTENHYLAYGPLAARSLNADFVTIAWSGAWLSSKAPPGPKVIPHIYGRTLGVTDKNPWDFSKWVPQVVVINLGTNDFSGGIPDAGDWTTQYEAFVEEVRSHYPHAAFFLATGPMLAEETTGPMRKDVQAVVEFEHAKGDQNVYAVEFPAQKYEDGLGADYHPSLKTHQKMAEQLVAAIKKQLAW